MNILKQSTAATIKLGPFIDDSDGKTAETGLTISQADIRLSKNGGDIAQTNNSAGATHDELGYYNVPLDTTDTNTLGRLLIAVHESGALPVWKEFLVVTANVYDTLCSTDTFDVNVATIATDAITAASLKADAVTEITNDIFAEVIENSLSYKQVIQVMAAVLAGKVTGGATGTITFKDLADAVNRVVMTVDASGNRSAVQTNFS